MTGKSATIHHLFEEIAAAYPDRVALIHGDESWSYARLDACAERIADQLEDANVHAGDLVALSPGRKPESVAAMLAVLKCGCAYLPLDTELPADRVRHMIADSGAVAIASHGDPGAAFAGLSISVIRTETAADVPDGERRRARARPGTSTDAAYVIYTSGSSGAPKAVVVEHGNVLRLFETSKPLFRLRAGMVWSVLHSFAFDFSIWELWGALLHGGTAVLAPAGAAANMVETARLLRAHRVSMMSFTPGAFSLFAQAAIDAELDFPDLEHVVFGGERLDRAHIAAWIGAYPNVSLVNMYGITETTVHVTWKRLDVEAIMAGAPISIGTPLPDLDVHLLDATGRPVPAGQTGEIVVTGPGLARGYLNRPDLNRERFPTLPIGPGGRAVRAYRSGDLAKLVDGELFYEGRNDDQVKVRGYRVEPGEVCARVAEATGVAAAAVVRQALTAADSRLIAFVVPGPDWSGPEAVIRSCASTLPSYMRPSLIVAVERLPLTANGKIDRAALLAGLDADDAGGTAEAGRDVVSETVLRLARETLRVSDLSIDEDLFEQGATSLSLVRLLLAVNRSLGTKISGVELDGDSSIRNIARIAIAGRAEPPYLSVPS